MRYFLISICIAVITVAYADVASARLIKPKCSEGDTDPECENEMMGAVDVNRNMNISSMTYSATWDASLNPLDLNLTSFPVCLYDRTQNPPRLVVNNFFTSDKAKVLLGIKSPSSCPLPGSQVFSDYPQAIAGEFLISGVICVVNSIMFDAMFRVYCTIVLWFYNILFSMIVIYVMFYGLAVMIGIGKDPIKEAPKRVLKIIIIFTLAVNAQVGYRFVHNGFLTALTGFTDMLVDLQPYTDENGQPAYKKSLLSSVGANFLQDQGPLLDENGNKWKPAASSEYYFDIFYFNYLKAQNPDYTAAELNTLLQSQYYSIPTGLPYTDSVDPAIYSPFRIPEMQWTYAEVPKDSGNYKMYPVFQPLTDGTATVYSDLETNGYQEILCMMDFKWNAYPLDEDYNALDPRLELYPRCNRNLWPTMPNMAPYGEICKLKIDNRDNVDINGDGAVDAKDAALKGRVVPANDTPGTRSYCKPAALDGNTVTDLTEPKRLKKISYVNGGAVDTADLNTTCDPLTWWTCRKPFQGVLNRIDSMFKSVLGNDNGKNIGSMAIALALWAAGSGILLSLFLMTGLVTMLVATMQLIWTYVTAIMALSFMLMLSPIFISCALFKVTENLFKGWLAACVTYAFQPFLIMAFLYMLSNMVSLDVLAKLSKTEIGNKVYMMNSDEGQTKISFNAESFIPPLYEKPADFDEIYYKSATSNPTAQAGAAASSTPVFISAAQRSRYIWDKSEYILNYWSAKKCGTSIGLLHLEAERNKLANCTTLNNLRRIWYQGEWEGGCLASPSKCTNRRGIHALMDYRWHYDPVNIPAGQTQNPNNPGGQNNAVMNAYNDLIECWTQGCRLKQDQYQFNCDPTNNNPLTAPEYQCEEYTGLHPVYGTSVTADDNDAFIGEPASADPNWGTKPPEYPRCVKYCPKFEPAYIANDASKVNPRLDAAATKRLTPTGNNGEDCPDVVNNLQPWQDPPQPDQNPDVCAPTAKCTKYCMTVPQGLRSNYGTLMTGAIVWVFLNLIIAAFMTMVPKLAAALANWEGAAPSDGAGTIAIGGASKRFDETGMNQWTRAEQSSVYTVGGLLDPGIFSGSAGGVFRFGDKLARTAAGQYKQVDKDGTVSYAGYEPPLWDRSPAAMQRRKQIKQADQAAKMAEWIKKEYLGMSDPMAKPDRGEVKIGTLVGKVQLTSGELFSQLRPISSTGLKHSEIWRVIEEKVGQSMGTGDLEGIRQLVNDAIKQLLQQKADESSKAGTGGSNNTSGNTFR